MRIILFACAIIFIVSILITPAIPFQDYGDWAYQAKVFKEILVANPIFLASFKLNSPIIPNSASTVIMGLMDCIMPSELSGKIFITLTFIFLFLGLKRLFGRANVSNIMAESLALIFAPSIFFFAGYLSYNFGLAILLLLIPYSHSSDSRWTEIAKYAIFFLLLYYIHFIVLTMAVVIVMGIRYLRKDAMDKKISNFLAALVPVALLFLLYLMGPSQLQSDSIWDYKILSKLVSYFHALALFYRFNDFSSITNMLLIIIINAIAELALAIYMYYLAKDKLSYLWKSEYVKISMIMMILAILTPFKIAGFGFYGDRLFWLAVVFLLAAVLAISTKITRKMTTITAIISSLFLLVHSATIIVQGIQDKELGDKIEAAITPGTQFSFLMTKFELPEYLPEFSGIVKIVMKVSPSINTNHRVPISILINRGQIWYGFLSTGILHSNNSKCDAKSIITGRVKPTEEICRNLLFMSPNYFSDKLKADLAQHFKIIHQGKSFIYASYKNTD
jgi:hypothetical protein